VGNRLCSPTSPSRPTAHAGSWGRSRSCGCPPSCHRRRHGSATPAATARERDLGRGTHEQHHPTTISVARRIVCLRIDPSSFGLLFMETEGGAPGSLRYRPNPSMHLRHRRLPTTSRGKVRRAPGTGVGGCRTDPPTPWPIEGPRTTVGSSLPTPAGRAHERHPEEGASRGDQHRNAGEDHGRFRRDAERRQKANVGMSPQPFVIARTLNQDSPGRGSNPLPGQPSPPSVDRRSAKNESHATL
jgi:hypothetical protein